MDSRITESDFKIFISIFGRTLFFFIGRVASRWNESAIREEMFDIFKAVNVVNFEEDSKNIHFTATGNPEKTLNVIVRNKEKDKAVFLSRSFEYQEVLQLQIIVHIDI